MQTRRRQIEILVDPRQAVPRDGREYGQGIDQKGHTGGLWGGLFPCPDSRSGSNLRA